MFSGIIEAQSNLVSLTPENHTTRLKIKRPENWTDLKVGDSICVNGACLTIQTLSSGEIEFILGPETLRILQEEKLFKRPLNLERSLPVGGRIHGHIVLGHVDGLGELTKKSQLGSACEMKILLPEMALPYVWYKGSIALSGVSLTINSVQDREIEVCLIPETLKSTNLDEYEVGDLIPFEIDNMSRAWVRQFQVQQKSGLPQGESL